MNRLLQWIVSISFLWSAVGFAIDLTPEQRNALNDVVQIGDFSVRIVQKKRDRTIQNVIIVGGNHGVNNDKKDLAKKLLEQFALSGVEGRLSRNQTMCKNIERVLRVRPDTKTMLVAVGKNHVSGMVKILTDRYSYHEVPLDKI